MQNLEELQQNDADPDKFKDEIQLTKDNLEKEIEYKTKGALIRCKVQWYEEGEKPTKYFLNLEKRNYKNKVIGQLRLANWMVTTDKKTNFE